MAVIKYTIEYNQGEASAVFNVDNNFFTAEKALMTLDFFLWDYDKDNDPIDEVLKKYALKCFEISAKPSFDSVARCKSEFQDMEGFCRIDGSSGINLIRMESFDFDEDEITVIKQY